MCLAYTASGAPISDIEKAKMAIGNIVCVFGETRSSWLITRRSVYALHTLRV